MPERSDLETCCLIPEHRRIYFVVACADYKLAFAKIKQMVKNKNCVLHPGSFKEYEPGIFRAIAIPKNK
jgi:hypothetical protein